MVKSDLRVSSNSEVSSTLKQRERDREVSDEPAPVTEASLHRSELWLQICSSALSASYREQPKLALAVTPRSVSRCFWRAGFEGRDPEPLGGVGRSNAPPQNARDITREPCTGGELAVLGITRSRKICWRSRTLRAVDVGGVRSARVMRWVQANLDRNRRDGTGKSVGTHPRVEAAGSTSTPPPPPPPSVSLINPWNYLVALSNFPSANEERVGTDAESKPCVFSSADQQLLLDVTFREE